MSQFLSLFPHPFPLIGVIHLLPLPGSPGHRPMSGVEPLHDIRAHARAEAITLVDGGIDGIIVENFGDSPFFPDEVEPITVAAMALAVHEVMTVARPAGVPVGVNVLRNDARAALSIAGVTGADFIRVNVLTGAMVTDQGLVQGRAHEVLRLRHRLGLDAVAVFADVLVKHATPLGEVDPVASARDTYLRGGADALIFSGSGTGEPTDLARLSRVREKLPQAPFLIGSGMTLERLAETAQAATGAIVGTALKAGGRVENPIELARVKALVAARDGLRLRPQD